MTELEKVDTKLKIMEVAERLFSRFGYEGASVREIAKEANANVASINYYFKNKHGLYWAVMDEAHMKLENGIKELAERVSSVEELAAGTFDFLLEEKRAFRNAMKMMLGEEGIPEPDGGIQDLYCARHLGPPGGQYIKQMLVNEVGDLSDDKIDFAMKSVFAMIVQWGMIFMSSKMKLMKKADASFNEESIKELLRHHCRATIAYVKGTV